MISASDKITDKRVTQIIV